METIHELSFRLLHVAKYAKNHYRRTNDLFADLKLCLQKDDYTPEDERDVLGILTANIPKFIFKNRDAAWVLTQVRDACHPKLTSRHGYYHKDDNRSDRERKEGGEINNQPYNFDKALVRYLLSELAFTDMVTLGLKDLPEQCIPELYKESTMYCDVILTPPNNESDKSCPVCYNDYGILIQMEGNENEPNAEPQHVHFCSGRFSEDSKEGEIAYSESDDKVGVNEASFDPKNKRCIASSDMSFRKPWNVLAIPQPLINVLVLSKGKIKSVEIVVDKQGNPITKDNLYVVLGSEWMEYAFADLSKEKQLV